jgi:inosine/xanthosine triphosphatase
LIIAVGSTNGVKVSAVQDVIEDYPMFANAIVVSVSVSSDVADQPLTLDEMTTGARNRARKAFEVTENCTYSFGIESGLYEAKGFKTGYLESAVCCIYDGNEYHYGLSCGFEIPPKVLNTVLEQKLNLNDACFAVGLTENKSLGAAEGLVGMLTKGRINRYDYTRQCVTTALIHLENASLYSQK